MNSFGFLPKRSGRKQRAGNDRRIWPWGNSFKDPANTVETGLDRICAVGSFPLNKSNCGVMDMAGNVFEWCQSKYQEYPYRPDDGREELDGDDDRVLRGGSFNSCCGDVRCACRGRLRPSYRYSFVGFRVVVAPALRI